MRFELAAGEQAHLSLLYPPQADHDLFLRHRQKLKNGANEIRTHDLLHAMQALSQLSYGPIFSV